MARETIEDVIKGITSKNDISPAQLEHLSKAVCIIEKIKSMQQQENEYSENSYRRGKMRHGSYSTRRYNDSVGYSGHSIKDRMIDKLEQMFDEAKTDHERDIVQDWIDRLTYAN